MIPRVPVERIQNEQIADPAVHISVAHRGMRERLCRAMGIRPAAGGMEGGYADHAEIFIISGGRCRARNADGFPDYSAAEFPPRQGTVPASSTGAVE